VRAKRRSGGRQQRLPAEAHESKLAQCGQRRRQRGGAAVSSHDCDDEGLRKNAGILPAPERHNLTPSPRVRRKARPFRNAADPIQIHQKGEPFYILLSTRLLM
jgi:hypothetical protein